MLSREIEQALALHRSTAVLDLHSDIPEHIRQARMRGEPGVFLRHHLPELVQAGVHGFVGAVGGDMGCVDDPPRGLLETLEGIEALYQEAEESAGQLRVCTDLTTFGQGAPVEALLCLEGGAPLLGRLAILRLLYRLGLRVLVPTWNFRNLLADGCGEERTGGGLTAFGVSVVQEANRLGIVLELSHLSRAGVRDVLALSKAPITIAHTGAAAVTPHVRNVTDEQIRAVVAQGGLIGIAFHPSFMGGRTLDHVVAHVVHLHRVAGAEGVGIGADFVDYLGEAVAARLAASGIQYGTDHRYPEGLETIAGLPRLTAALRDRGWSDADLRGLLGGNFQRVCREVAAAAERLNEPH